MKKKKNNKSISTIYQRVKVDNIKTPKTALNKMLPVHSKTNDRIDLLCYIPKNEKKFVSSKYCFNLNKISKNIYF